jgi:two-component system response regulator EvgA
VLIVDDHPAFRSLAHQLLDSAGFQVIGEADSGQSAITKAGELRPACVLLDVLLPDLDGFEVAEQLATGAAPPVVVLTSSRSATEFGSRLKRASVHGFISKRDMNVDTIGNAFRA